MMNERPTQQKQTQWKWVAIVLLFLLILMCTCVTSLVWGGVVGYAIGRNNEHMSMGHDWQYGPYAEPAPDFPPFPDVPEMPMRPDLVRQPWLGVGFVMEPDGARVTSVVPGSPAEDEGLEVNDLITEVDGLAVSAAHPLDALILSYTPGDRIELTVIRDGREQLIRVRLTTRMDGEVPGLPNSFPVEPPLIPDWHG